MLNTPNATFQQGRAIGATNGLESNVESLPVRLRSQINSNGYGRRILANPRTGSLLLYTIAALGLSILCALAFNALEHNTEFAIAVMGSLIGGFLGALLASALIVDIHLNPNPPKDVLGDSP